MKILIVDDTPTSRKLLRALLEDAGHSTVEAADGVEAFALLEKSGADAIISDILMPRMDGYQLCYNVRKDDRFRALPFIIYTATFTSQSSARLASEVGADLFLKKPTPNQGVLDAIDQLADKKKQERPPAVISADHNILKEYSAVLVAKLENKCAELEHSKTQLTALTEELEHRLRTMGDAIPHIVWRAGPEGGVHYYNTRWYDYTKLSYEQTREWGWKAVFHPDDHALAVEKWDQSLRTGAPYEVECRIKRGTDGSFRWFLVRALATRDESGAIVQWIGTCTDMDDHKRIEQELVRSNVELERFAYVASHDLQEPMRTVQGFATLLARSCGEGLKADTSEYLAFVVSGVQRMQTLIRDLLAYSRVNSQGAAFAPADCNEICAKVLEDLHTTIESNQARVEVDTLPVVNGDATQLGQLFQNLIVNATKFRGPQVPCIRVSAKTISDDWVFSIRDNGIGIAPQYFERIFVMFQRLHTIAEYGGTGIGLAICKKIAERHGGRIWVESVVGEGSTFYVSIPQRLNAA